MKNRGIAWVVSVSLTALLVCPSASAASRRKFSFGVYAGGGPVGASSSPALRTGFETSLRLGRHLALAGSASYGAISLKTQSRSGNYYSNEIQTWSVVPAALVARYEAVLSEATLVSVGAGVAYAFLKRTLTSDSNSPGYPLSKNETSFGAWMPRLEVGLELFVGKDLSFAALIGYEFGKAEQESVYYTISSANDFSFGGPTLVIGARVYLF